MEDTLQDLVLVFLVAGGVLALFQRLRLPAIVGLLLAGFLIGPAGLGVLTERAEIEQLAELGILLLMFSIGLDFTPDRFRELARAAGMGVGQMAICIVVTILVAMPFTPTWQQAVLLGFLISHTSSTLMLKLFLDRGELSSPQVRLGLGISITQDLSSVPMLLVIPVMAGGADGSGASFALELFKVGAVLAVALVLARWVIPFWLHHVIRSRSRELFLIFLVIVSIGTGYATLALGLSSALGAFLAGMAIASSAYSHQTLAEVVPFRDLLVSLFFISVGMLVEIGGIVPYLMPALLVMVPIVFLKFLSGFLPVLFWGYPLRIATLVGAGIAQIGEFSFVVAHAGQSAGIISLQWFQVFLFIAVVTMLINPFVIAAGPSIYGVLKKVPRLRRFERGSLANDEQNKRENHVVIAGYGLNGQTVAQALRALDVPFVAMDLNPDTVEGAQAREEPVLYGDCTRGEVLRKADIETARDFVVAISDLQATRQAVQVARHENRALHIIVRTKYMSEVEVLRRLGADEVIAEEFETTLEILARVLHSFNVPRLKIEETVQHFRTEGYQAFRGPSALPVSGLLGDVLPSLQFEVVTVRDRATAIGKTLRELDLRARTGATLLAVQRGAELETVPGPEAQLREGDVVVLVGTPRQILSAAGLLESGEGE